MARATPRLITRAKIRACWLWTYEDDVRSDGTFKDRSQHAMDSRANFFDNRNSYLLYIWIMLEKYQLLASTLQRLDDSIAGRDGTTSGLPSICNRDDDDDNLSSATSKFDSEMTVLKGSIENHGKSIVRAAQITCNNIR